MLETMKEKIEFVNSFEPQYKKFEIQKIDNKEILVYKDNGKKVENLSILIEYLEKNSLIFKYGEYEQLIPLLKAHSVIPNSDFRIIQVPLEDYKWIEFCFEHSASNWVNIFLEYLNKKNK